MMPVLPACKKRTASIKSMPDAPPVSKTVSLAKFMFEESRTLTAFLTGP
jgi:hypothetical protein